jgi:hypothetical protein
LSGHARLPALGLAALASLAVAAAVPATAIRSPLTVTDATGSSGTITVETPDWRLVFDALYNGGIHQWFDLAADPGATESLAGAFAGTFPYSQGALFGYQAYLSTAPAMEFMTTMGANPGPGSLELSVLESTPARVRIRQRGQPRLNNGSGPLSDVFPEMGLITATTVWTIYPTGKVHLDFTTEVEEAGITVDSAPGGAGKGVDAPGNTALLAVGGADFREGGVLPGDTIESAGGGWGPIRIVARPSDTQLGLAAAVPAGTALDYVVRRRDIAGETISIHGDGDPNGGCTVRRWQAGSNDKPLWDDGFFQVVPNLAGQFLLAQWTTAERSAGSLLTFFEQPWADPNLAVFDSCFYLDISYTQIGRFTTPEPPAERHLHLLAHMGSAATCGLPTIKSVADALPFALDYRSPWAEALVGTLETGPEIAAAGFDPGAGAYGVTASSVAPSVCGQASPPCYEAVVRLDTQGGSRGGAEYRTPAIVLGGFPVADGAVSVEVSADGGASFAPLPWRLFNLTGEGEEGQLGAGRRLFQYLTDVPASAAGASAVAFRFRGPVTPAPPPPPTGPCATAPLAGCRAPAKSTLVVKNPAGGALDKIVWRWVRGDTPVASFGDPTACEPGFALCVYDAVASAPALALAAELPSGGVCAGAPCWKTVGGIPAQGFRYKDPNLGQSGLRSLVLRGGQPGLDKIVLKGKGANLPLPSPATPTQFFQHEGNVVVQLVRDTGECWEGLFAPADASQNRPDLYKASAGD